MPFGFHIDNTPHEIKLHVNEPMCRLLNFTLRCRSAEDAAALREAIEKHAIALVDANDWGGR